MQADKELVSKGQKACKLEDAANSLRKLYAVTIGDRSPLEYSKKLGALPLVNSLFRIYFKVRPSFCSFLRHWRPPLNTLESLVPFTLNFLFRIYFNSLPPYTNFLFLKFRDSWTHKIVKFCKSSKFYTSQDPKFICSLQWLAKKFIFPLSSRVLQKLGCWIVRYLDSST
jgi:hypothetical protein